MAQIREIETTPNPLAMKVYFDQQLITTGSRHFNKKEDAADQPFIASIFNIDGVSSIFIMDDFLTVNKKPAGNWDKIFFELQEIISSTSDFKTITPTNDLPKMEAAPAKPIADFIKMSDEEKIGVINQLIDEAIRPGLARDGGGLEILGIDGNYLKVKYQGACGSCPSSTTGTLNYISNLLQTRVNPDLIVIPA